MSYAQKDNSVQEGQPVEFYKFTSPLGTFRFTSDNEPGICNGELYLVLPGGITRTSIETGSVVDTVMTMDFTFRADTDLARLYCYQTTPELMNVEVRRAHRGDDWNTEWEMEWMGYGLDVSGSGPTITIKTGSVIQAKLNGNIASIYYQRMCNHMLFDERCKVNKDDWTITSTITKVQRQLITVENDQSADGELKAGEIEHVRTGEKRSIYDNSSNIITIGYPFGDAQVGDEVRLVFGCDHKRLGHCKNRFNNVQNFGGFPFIPVENPFTDLQFEGKTLTKIKQDFYERYTLPGMS